MIWYEINRLIINSMRYDCWWYTIWPVWDMMGHLNWYDLLPLIFLQGSSIIITKAKFSHDSVNFQFSISNHDVSFKRTFEVILRIIWLDIFYAAPFSDFGVNFIELNYCSVSCHACLEHFGIHSNVRWIPNTRIPSAR